MVYHLIDSWHISDSIALSPAETQLKTDLEEFVRSGLVIFLHVRRGLEPYLLTSAFQASVPF